MPPFLILEGLDKSFGSQAVLRNLSLEVNAGEVLALLGPSGSGKTTALRLIAGFEAPDRGKILVGGEDVTALPPEKRHFGMVFQHYALFPHLNVRENVAFGLAGRKLGKDETARKVADALALVELPGFEARRVGEISGGQQQRIALARALAPEPRVLLLDEPLSNLDPTLRERTRRELLRAVRRVGITTVLVTHEQEEAFHLGNRVAVLHGGVLHQVAAPEELYERPATRFVAGFVGRASGLPGILTADGGVRIGDVIWPGLPAPDVGTVPGTPVELVVRPESLAFSSEGDRNALAGRVVERRYAGSATFYAVELAMGREVEVLASAGAAAEGDTVRVAPAPGGLPARIFRAAPEVLQLEDNPAGPPHVP
ncbi:MAG TPA: ABC transporter ATP-binding protein [Thermoanaerobaculia bacterium]|jgi:ABC-type Fe3+/spermidine/putrescine transport system ATPase subunit|nr:ABC transporter ATP-binding protein [Thermoanaerobaculia bacterium]